MSHQNNQRLDILRVGDSMVADYDIVKFTGCVPVDQVFGYLDVMKFGLWIQPF